MRVLDVAGGAGERTRGFGAKRPHVKGEAVPAFAGVTTFCRNDKGTGLESKEL